MAKVVTRSVCTGKFLPSALIVVVLRLLRLCNFLLNSFSSVITGPTHRKWNLSNLSPTISFWKPDSTHSVRFQSTWCSLQPNPTSLGFLSHTPLPSIVRCFLIKKAFLIAFCWLRSILRNIMTHVFDKNRLVLRAIAIHVATNYSSFAYSFADLCNWMTSHLYPWLPIKIQVGIGSSGLFQGFVVKPSVMRSYMISHGEARIFSALSQL